MFFMFLTHMSNFIQIRFCERLDRNYLASGVLRFVFFFFFFSFFFSRVSAFRRQISLFMHCSFIVHGTYNYFIQKKNIKNGSHGTIHIFKNNFATVFSVFSKISCIQTNPLFTIRSINLFFMYTF